MPRVVVLGLVTALFVGGAVCSRFLITPAPEPLFEPANRPPQLAPMCPWRNPEADLPRLFPGASRWETETRILSGLRSGLAGRLGRTPTANENALQVRRVYRGDEVLGEITTRRVKGAHGAIEIVLAADTSGQLKRILLQRAREPETVSQALEGSDWDRWFAGRRAESTWDCNDLIARLPPEAHESARAIVEGVRSSMVLLAASERAPRQVVPLSQNH